MSDEMPDVLYAAYDDDADINNRKYLAGTVEAQGDTKFLSQASSNQAVRDALDELYKLFAKDSMTEVDDAYDMTLLRHINNLKSKYEGE